MVAIGCVALAHHSVGGRVSFALLYLLPICFATWFVSLAAGVALSVAGALASFAAGLRERSMPIPAEILTWNFAVDLGTFLAAVALLGVLKGRLEAEQQLARTDSLTLIPNRRAFLELAAVELERVRRTGCPITVAYLDCDDFKDINDRFGHSQGDALLFAVASTLRSGTRALDVVARLGGDEFGLLLTDTDGPTAEVLVARIRAALAEAMAENGWAVSFSIGTATFEVPPRSVDDMLGHADQLMYDTKRSGKNAARFEVVGRAALVTEKAAG